MHYAFFLNKPKWPLTQTNLTQALVSHDPHNGILQNAVWRSFGNWVAVNQCTFEEVTMGTGDRLTGRMQWSAMHLLRRMERCILMGMGGGRCCKGERIWTWSPCVCMRLSTFSASPTPPLRVLSWLHTFPAGRAQGAPTRHLRHLSSLYYVTS